MAFTRKFISLLIGGVCIFSMPAFAKKTDIMLQCNLTDKKTKVSLTLQGYTKSCSSRSTSCTPGPGYNCNNTEDQCEEYERNTVSYDIENVSCGGKIQSFKTNFHNIESVKLTLNCDGKTQVHERQKLKIGYGDITSQAKYVVTGNCSHGKGVLQSEEGNKIGAVLEW